MNHASSQPFQDWNELFMIALNMQGELPEVLPIVIKWIEAIQKKSEVSEPLTTADIPFFLNTTLPDGITKILNFEQLYEKDVIAVTKFLQTVVQFFECIPRSKSIKLIETYAKIFVESSNLYRHNPVIYSEVINSFKDIYDKTDLLSEISELNDKRVTRFCFIYFLTLICCNIPKDKRQNILTDFEQMPHDLSSQFLYNLQRTLKNPTFFDDQKHLDLIKKCFDSLMKLDSVWKIPNEQMVRFIQFFQKTLKMTHPKIQEFSAHCISTLVKSSKNMEIIKNSYLDPSDMIIFLLSLNLSPQALSELKYFIELEIEQNKIDLAKLIEIWTICSSLTQSYDNQILIDICVSPLKSFNAESIELFLSLIQQNLTPFYYKILAKTVTELSLVPRTIPIAQSSAFLLLNLSLVDEKARYIFLDLIQKNINSQIAHGLFEESMHLLKTEQYQLGTQFMISLINTSSDPTHLFDTNYSVQQLLSMTNETNKSDIKEILLNYYLKLGNFPHEELIDIFLPERSDSTWYFFYRLLKSTASQSRKDLDRLYQAIIKEDFTTASLHFFKFCKYFVFKYNQSNFINQIMNVPIEKLKHSFTVTSKNSIFGLDIIFSIYIDNEDNQVVLKAKRFLLKILENWSNDKSVSFIMAQFELHKSSALYPRIIELILQFIRDSEITSDPEDFKCPRHIYPYNYFFLSYKIDNQKEGSFHINPQHTIMQLKERIAYRENYTPESIRIVGFEKQSNSSKLFQCGIASDLTLEVKIDPNPKQYFYSKPPTYFFHEQGLSDLLLTSLDNIDVGQYEEQAYELLKLLPTSSSIASMIVPGYFLKPNNFAEFDMKTIDYMIELIQQTQNEYKILYFIQALAQNNLNLLLNESGQIIISNLMKKEKFIDSLTCIINSVYKNEIFDHHSIVLILIEHLFHCRQNEIIDITLKLLNRISERNDIFSEEILQILLDLFNNLQESHWRLIINLIVKMNKFHHEFLLSFIIDHIVSFESPRYLLRIFGYILSETDIDIILPISGYLINLISTTVDTSILIDVLNCIYQIIKTFSTKVDLFQLPIETLISIAFGTQYNSIQKPIFQILKLFMNNTANFLQINSIVSQIKEFIKYPLDKWGYNPSLYARTVPYTGIRNLGATCFMNAVFQQLYHLFPIRYMISTYQFDEKSELNPLQKIMIQMMFTSRSYVDSTNFIETYHCWSSELLNPKEQQDAVEFFTSLMDSLPNCITNMFKGTMVNFISGLDIQYEKTSKDTFYTLSLSIKGHDDINSSFNDLIQEEQLADYELDDKKLKISAKKYTKMAELPKVLVIQLARFEYSAVTHDRIKINDKFEFPLELDIQRLCEESIDETSFMYDLSGIILHSGCANGGHYISYIRKNNEWWDFNDIEITKMNEKEVKENAFGGKDSCLSAYVLFYTKRDFESKTDSNKELTFDSEFDYSDEIKGLEEIKKDNDIFQKTQALFGANLIDFIQSINDPILNLSFYIRVLCRSTNDQKAQDFTSNFLDILNQNNEEKQSNLIKCANYLNSNFIDVFNDFLNCSIDIFLDCLIRIASYIFNTLDSSKASLDVSFEFFEKFLNEINNHKQSYRQIPLMLDFIENYISKHQEPALSREWFRTLMNLLDSFYDASLIKNQLYMTNINLSSLFKMLLSLCEATTDKTFLDNYDIFKESNYIKNNQAHLPFYKQFVTFCIKKFPIMLPEAEKQSLNIDEKGIQDQYFHQLIKKILDTDNSGKLESDAKKKKIEMINHDIDLLISRKIFTEFDILFRLEEQIGQNSRLATEIVKLSPEIFMHKLIGTNVETPSAEKYQRFYNTLFKVTQSYLIISGFLRYLEDIVFDESKLNQFIPEIPATRVVLVNRIAEFKLPNLIKAIKLLLHSQPSNYTSTLAGKLIKMLETIDETIRYSTDYNFDSILKLLNDFPLSALEGHLNACISLYLKRANDIADSQQVSEFHQFGELINKFVFPNIPNPNDSHTQELICVLNDDDFFIRFSSVFDQFFKMKHSIFDISKHPIIRLLEVYLILIQTNESMKQKAIFIRDSIIQNTDFHIPFEMVTTILDSIIKNNKDLLDHDTVTYFFNEFIKTDVVNSYNIKLQGFINVIKSMVFEKPFDDIIYEPTFFKKIQAMPSDALQSLMEWLDSHAPRISMNFAHELITLPSYSLNNKLAENLIAIIVKRHDVDTLLELVKKTTSAYIPTLIKKISTSIQKLANENMNWFVPFIIEYFVPLRNRHDITEYELISFVFPRIDKEENIRILDAMEEAFKTIDYINQNFVTGRFLLYLDNSKDVLDEFKQKTTLTSDYVNSKQLDLMKRNQLTKILFE